MPNGLWKRADKIAVLAFILERQVVTVYDLMDEFEYEYGAARKRIYRLRKQRLIKRIGKGEYCLDEDGYKKLDHYGKL